MDVGKSEVSSGMPVGEFSVINAHQMQHRCMEVVDMCPVLHSPITKFVSVTVAETTLHPAPGQPDRESVVIVISASTDSSPNGNLSRRGTSELTTHDYQRLV